MGELQRAKVAALQTHRRLNVIVLGKEGLRHLQGESVAPSPEKGGWWTGWVVGAPAKQAPATGRIFPGAASREIYSITGDSLPRGFHQFHYLSRELDLTQKPPLQIVIKGAGWASDVCCLWLGNSSLSYPFSLSCSLPLEGVIPSPATLLLVSKAFHLGIMQIQELNGP